MTILLNGFLDLAAAETRARRLAAGAEPGAEETVFTVPPPPPPSAEQLRQVAWEIGERRPADAHAPAAAHVGLAAVSPGEGFAHWRIPSEWVERTARGKGTVCDRAAGTNSPLRSRKPTSASCQVPGRGSAKSISPHSAGMPWSWMRWALRPLNWM